jgi:hypothetical protein
MEINIPTGYLVPDDLTVDELAEALAEVLSRHITGRMDAEQVCRLLNDQMKAHGPAWRGFACGFIDDRATTGGGCYVIRA